MIVESNSSFSPNSYKGRLCVERWQKDRLPVEIKTFSKISREALYLAHDKEYVDGVLDLKIANGYGSIDQAISNSLPYVVSSMVEAGIHSYLSGENTVSPTGGFHHAGYSAGAGFCTFNALIVTAQMVQQLGAKSVGIVDLDQHYGDGTDNIIQKLNLNYIKHYSSGSEFLTPEAASSWLNDLKEQLYEFESCNLILYNAGVDSGLTDPLGGYLTDSQLVKRDQIVYEVFSKLKIPVATCNAGGYERDSNGSLSPVIKRHTETLKANIKFGLK